VVNRIKSAIVNFIKAAQCVVVETLLAAFGVFLDQTIQTAFPPIKAMTMTPMCVTKAAKQAEKKPPPVHPPPPSSLEKGITSGYKGITSGSARNEMLGRKPSSAEAWKAIGEAFQGVVKNPSRRSIVMFIWQLFVFIVNKIDNDSLNKFVSSAATKTIMWLVNMIWDALCGNFGTALMSLLAQLIFCNWEACNSKCVVQAFNFGDQPTQGSTDDSWDDNMVDTLDAGRARPTLEKSDYHSSEKTCSARPITLAFALKDGGQGGGYGVSTICDDPQCNVESYDGLDHTALLGETSESESITAATMNKIEYGEEGSGSHCDIEQGCLNGHRKCKVTSEIDINPVGCSDGGLTVSKGTIGTMVRPKCGCSYTLCMKMRGTTRGISTAHAQTHNEASKHDANMLPSCSPPVSRSPRVLISLCEGYEALAGEHKDDQASCRL
jgi:hypothetical protein